MLKEDPESKKSDLLQNPLIVPLKRLNYHKPMNDFGVLDLQFHPTQPWGDKDQWEEGKTDVREGEDNKSHDVEPSSCGSTALIVSFSLCLSTTTCITCWTLSFHYFLRLWSENAAEKDVSTNSFRFLLPVFDVPGTLCTIVWEMTVLLRPNKPLY
ncbi:unnamed protein product [Timema podura]|uniref:Uncharacterized protein n=1 Tax=Timema podura TaxID=61482 RepID=A0ABN7P4M7_TIMPD|nr:unnamed protein product [Timema podura]